MVAWLPRKGPLVLLVSFLPPLSFIHSLPSPSRVGGGTRSVSSMGSSDPPSSWSLPRFPGFMSKRQWAAEGASRGRRAARQRIFLGIKSREKKTEPTDLGTVEVSNPSDDGGPSFTEDGNSETYSQETAPLLLSFLARKLKLGFFLSCANERVLPD